MSCPLARSPTSPVRNFHASAASDPADALNLGPLTILSRHPIPEQSDLDARRLARERRASARRERTNVGDEGGDAIGRQSLSKRRHRRTPECDHLGDLFVTHGALPFGRGEIGQVGPHRLGAIASSGGAMTARAADAIERRGGRCTLLRGRTRLTLRSRPGVVLARRRGVRVITRAPCLRRHRPGIAGGPEDSGGCEEKADEGCASHGETFA